VWRLGRCIPSAFRNRVIAKAVANANDKASGRHAPVGSFTMTIMGGVTTKFGEGSDTNQLDYNSELTFEIGEAATNSSYAHESTRCERKKRQRNDC
jgi:hypothetical protein